MYVTLYRAVLMKFRPARADIGLLVLRVWIGATLFLGHGWEKRSGQWQHFVTSFPDPVGDRTVCLLRHRVRQRLPVRAPADRWPGHALGRSVLLREYSVRLGFSSSL